MKLYDRRVISFIQCEAKEESGLKLFGARRPHVIQERILGVTLWRRVMSPTRIIENVRYTLKHSCGLPFVELQSLTYEVTYHQADRA